MRKYEGVSFIIDNVYGGGIKFDDYESGDEFDDFVTQAKDIDNCHYNFEDNKFQIFFYEIKNIDALTKLYEEYLIFPKGQLV